MAEMLYLGTSDMPIYNFDLCARTNDLRYLVVGWNERAKITVPKGAEELWEEIMDKWNEKTVDNEKIAVYELEDEVNYMLTRYVVLEGLIMSLTEKNKKEFGKEIRAWGFPFDTDKTVEEQTARLEKSLRGAKMNLELKQNQLKLEKGDDDQEGMSLIKQKIYLEKGLGLKIVLKETSIDEWLELFEVLKESKPKSA